MVMDSALGLNVKDYGALGDQVTDDTTAFSTCIAAAGTAGRQVIIPPGWYVINGTTITLPTGTHLLGTGKQGIGAGTQSIIIRTVAGAPFEITSAARTDSCKFENLHFTGYIGGGDYTVGTVGILMEGTPAGELSRSHRIIDCYFNGLEKSIYVHATDTEHDWMCDNVMIRGCTFEENLHGIYMDSFQATQWKADGCTWLPLGGGTAIYILRGGGVNVNDCVGRMPAEDSIFIHVAGACDAFTVKDCQTQYTETGDGAFFQLDTGVRDTDGIGDGRLFPFTFIGCSINMPTYIMSRTKTVWIGCRNAVEGIYFDQGHDNLIYLLGCASNVGDNIHLGCAKNNQIMLNV